MRLRRLYWLVPLLLATLILQPAHKAYAHFPASDNEIDAVLHVEPDDYPASGTPQTIYLILSDVTGRFQLSNCACDLSISQGGHLLGHMQLVPPPAGRPTVYSTSGMPITFPSPGTYQVVATGQPLNYGAFQSFKLSWNLEVNPPLGSGHSTSYKTIFLIFGSLLAVFILIGALIFALS